MRPKLSVLAICTIFQMFGEKLSTSIYDLVLIYVCHFHHHHHHHHHPVIFLSNHGQSRYSCLHLGSLHPRILKIEIWTTVCYKYIGLYFQTKAYLILYPALKRVTTTTYYYIIQYKQMYVSDTLFYVLLH